MTSQPAEEMAEVPVSTMPEIPAAAPPPPAPSAEPAAVLGQEKTPDAAGVAAEPPPETASAAPASVEESIATLTRGLGAIESSCNDLAQKFEKRILANRYSETIIDRQHAELQQHKEGLTRTLLTPIVTDLIRLHDGLAASLAGLAKKENLTLEQALQSLETFPEEVGSILERQGLEPFAAAPGERFDPTRQRVLKRLPTESPDADKTVAASIRHGYAWEGKIFRPNVISLFAYEAPAAPGEPPPAS